MVYSANNPDIDNIGNVVGHDNRQWPVGTDTSRLDPIRYNNVSIISHHGGMSTISWRGHEVECVDGMVRCKHCDEEREIPDIIEDSSPIVRVSFKLYLLASFKRSMSCSKPVGRIEHTPREQYVPYDINDINTIINR